MSISNEPVRVEPEPWPPEQVIALVGAAMGLVAGCAAAGTLIVAADPGAFWVRLQACACLGGIGAVGGLTTRHWGRTLSGFGLVTVGALLMSLVGQVAGPLEGVLTVLVGAIWLAIAATPLVLLGVVVSLDPDQSHRERAVNALVAWVAAGLADAIVGFMVLLLWVRVKTELNADVDTILGLGDAELVVFMGILGAVTSGVYWWIQGLWIEFSRSRRRRRRSDRSRR